MDILAIINKEIEGLRGQRPLPKIPNFPETRETQGIDFIGSPENPENPDSKVISNLGGNFTARSEGPSAPRAPEVKESARAKDTLSEKSGISGVPYFSNTKGGRNPGFSGFSGESDLKDFYPSYLIDFFEERAAIREFDGGFTRSDAEGLAINDTVDEMVGDRADERLREEALSALRSFGLTQPIPTINDIEDRP